MKELIVRALSPLTPGASGVPTRVIECRRCGTSLPVADADCPYCGPTDTVTLALGA